MSIEVNNWYRFLGPDDRDAFIQEACATMNIDLPSPEVRSAQVLRVTSKKNGQPYFQYRSQYRPEYQGNFPIWKPSCGIEKDASIKENKMSYQGVKGCVGPCGIEGPRSDEVYEYLAQHEKKAQDPMVSIFDQWVHEKMIEMGNKASKFVDDSLLDSQAGRSLKHFIEMAQIYDKDFYLNPQSILQPSILSTVERGELDRGMKEIETQRRALEKKIFVLRNLLMAADTYDKKVKLLKKEGIIE